MDERGVSLVELLVAAALFALLALAVDAVFIAAHRGVRKAELGASVQQNARSVTERLTREIRESDLSDIRIASDGSWIAFKSARLASDGSVFCINATSGSLFNPACSPTGDTFTPLWQRWIVYWHDASANQIRREVQVLAADPAAPSGGDVMATSVRGFDARCSPATPIMGETICISLEAEGREVVQGSEVPPQEINLFSRVEIRND